MLNKVAFSTLGCKLNFAETDTIINKFLKKGYEYVLYLMLIYTS